MNRRLQRLRDPVRYALLTIAGFGTVGTDLALLNFLGWLASHFSPVGAMLILAGTTIGTINSGKFILDNTGDNNNA